MRTFEVMLSFIPFGWSPVSQSLNAISAKAITYCKDKGVTLKLEKLYS